jgi:membrane protease YdiL (CAAX protease family)
MQMPSIASVQSLGLLSAAEEAAGSSAAPGAAQIFWWVFWGVGWVILIWQLISLRQGDPLARCPVRRHRLPSWFVPSQLLIWMVGSLLISSVIKTGLPNESVWREAAAHLGTFFWYLFLLIVFLGAARFGFVRGFEGFGLDLRRLKRDFLQAVLTLWALLPLVFLSLKVTVWIGRLFCGPDFAMDQHTSLAALHQYPQLWLRGLIILNTVLVVPVFEEVLFRGLLQSTLTASLGKPWLSIAGVSLLFAMMHPYPTHLPALLILSFGLGYAYEKSGSLLQPIFMHILFNALNVTASLGGI